VSQRSKQEHVLVPCHRVHLGKGHVTRATFRGSASMADEGSRLTTVALEATTSRRGPGEGVAGAGEGTTCGKSDTHRQDGISRVRHSKGIECRVAPTGYEAGAGRPSASTKVIVNSHPPPAPVSRSRGTSSSHGDGARRAAPGRHPPQPEEPPRRSPSPRPPPAAPHYCSGTRAWGARRSESADPDTCRQGAHTTTSRMR
jgi:hypothetical protein